MSHNNYMNLDTCMKQPSTSKSSCSDNKNNTLIHERNINITSSPDKLMSDSSEEKSDYKQHNVTPVISNSPKRIYFNSSVELGTSKKARNIQPRLSNNNATVKVNKSGMNSLFNNLWQYSIQFKF